MRGLRMGIVIFGLLALPTWAGGESPWAGEWVTDKGRLRLTVDGGKVHGEFGNGGTFDGRVRGGKISFEGTEGRAPLNGTFKLDGGALTFAGEYSYSSGGGGKWRGWKQDPEATEGKPANFSGFWLTSLGNFRLTQKGNRVEGSWGSQGWASIEGTVKGRRLTFTWKRIQWSGPAWIEQTEDGARFFGLTEESPPNAWLGLRAPEFEPDPKPKAGEIVKGIFGNNMLYFLRAPKGWRKGKKTDAVVLLHGSNWTTAGMTWVTAKNWPQIADDAMIVGIQGEQWAPWSDADDLRFNYSYVNWMGKSTYEGYPYTDRESPFLVHQVIEELADRYDFDRIFLIGHSQGGFLAYILYMNYPETFAGVAPASGAVVIQAEPDVFDDEDLRAAQRATPLAMVHGTKDPNYGAELGESNWNLFVANGFPMLTLLTKPVGHGYDFLPIGEAFDWMDALSTKDDEKLLAFAEAAAKDDRWRDVAAALIRAEAIRKQGKFRDLAERLDREAGKKADDFLKRLEKGDDPSWAMPFREWKDQFEFAPAAAAVMKRFHALQAEQDPAAKALFDEGIAAMRKGDRATGYAKYEEIVGKYPAARCYRTVKKVLDDR